MLKMRNGDKKRVYFGVSDFSRAEEGVQIAFWTDTGLPDDERIRVEQGTVVAAIDEAGYNPQGAYETIGDYSVADSCSVTVCLSDRSPDVARGAKRLKEEAENGEFRGDFTLVEREDD